LRGVQLYTVFKNENFKKSNIANLKKVRILIKMFLFKLYLFILFSHFIAKKRCRCSK